MPSIAHQLRAERRRRERRRRAALGVLVGVLVAVVAVPLGTRLAATSAELASATSVQGATTSTDPTTSVAFTTTTGPTGLHPGLVDAFERARSEAADAGHRLTINSGFRTAEEQSALLEAEVADRGSRSEALWWVFPPERSMHVQGLAIDVGDGPAADWLAAEGARFGLCKTLAWEWWHVEWRARWEGSGVCPAPAQAPADAPQR